MPFDLDRVLAEQADARGDLEPFTFVFDGEEYELPPVRDIRAVSAIAAGHVYDGLAALLGPEQWERVQASPATLTSTAVRSLLDAYGEHIDGLNAGESSASSNSSTRTARPSKRTSNGSTGSRSRR